MSKCITGRNAFTGDLVEIRFGNTIEAVDELVDPAGGAMQGEIPYVAPGFIDLQVNGFAGADYNSAETPLEQIGRSLREQFSCGVTRLYPTVITGSEERILGSIRNLVRAKEELAEGASIEGFHVEGPFISPEEGPRGAHPVASVRAPDIEELKRWQEAARGLVRLVTVAPEWPEAARFIEYATGEGVVVAIGHTAANHEQIQVAVAAGATMSTHLGNGAHMVLARHPNYILEQMAEDRLSASFIADGIHLGDTFLKVALRAKGLDRAVLVTDAVMPAGCQPGPYQLGEVEVELLPPGDRVVLRGGTKLAGSALRMDDAVSNAMRMAQLQLREALALATINPARVGRIDGRQRGLRRGERADLVVFEVSAGGRIKVLETYLGGENVWTAADF